MKKRNLILKAATTYIAIGWLCWGAADVARAQNSTGLSPDVQEVIKLSQAQMPDDVIKNYIASTGKSFQLSADDIIYLNNRGVSSGVISALQTASSVYPEPGAIVATQSAPTVPVQVTTPSQPPNSAPVAYGSYPQPQPQSVSAPVVPESTPPPPPEVNFQYFHDQLAPFGSWVNVGGTMYWRPDQAVALNPDWRPYYDMGRWVDTDNGLYWQSDYTWGDIPFHYGRWVFYPATGWLWAPDYNWGPAWVIWRQDESDAAIGWAPLPVGAVYVNGGFMFNGVAVGLDFDFGVGESCFTFVSYTHFHEGFIRLRGHEWAYHVDRAREHGFYSHSVLRNDFRRDDHGRFVNDGIGRDRVTRLTHVEHASFEERKPVGDRVKMAVKPADEFHKSNNGPGDQGRDRNTVHDHAALPDNTALHDNTAHHDAVVQDHTPARDNTPVRDNGLVHDSAVAHDNSGHAQNPGNARAMSAGTVGKVYRPPTSNAGGNSPPQRQSQSQPQTQSQSEQQSNRRR